MTDRTGDATARSTRRITVWLAAILLAVGACGWGVAHLSPSASEPVLAITNTSNDAMEFYVGGDRVRIIKGHATEYLDLPVATWSWPRRIEVRRWPRGERLLSTRATLDDLARNQWRMRIP